MSPSPPAVPRGSHGVAVPWVSGACRRGQGPAAPLRPRGTGTEKPPGCRGEGEQRGQASCLLRPSTYLRRCSARAGCGPSHSATCPGPRLAMPGRTLQTGGAGTHPALGKAPGSPPNPCGAQEKGDKALVELGRTAAAREQPAGCPHPRDRGLRSLPPPDTTTQRHHAARIAAFSLKTHVQALAVQIFTAVYKCTKPKPNALEPGGVQLCKGPRAPPRAPYKNKGRLCWGARLCTGSWPPPAPWGPAPRCQHTPPPRAAAPRAKIPFSEPISHSGGCQCLKQGGERGCAPPSGRSLPTSPARAGPRGAPSPPAPRLLCFYLESADKPAAPPRPQRSRSELAIR